MRSIIKWIILLPLFFLATVVEELCVWTERKMDKDYWFDRLWRRTWIYDCYARIYWWWIMYHKNRLYELDIEFLQAMLNKMLCYQDRSWWGGYYIRILTKRIEFLTFHKDLNEENDDAYMSTFKGGFESASEAGWKFDTQKAADRNVDEDHHLSNLDEWVDSHRDINRKTQL